MTAKPHVNSAHIIPYRPDIDGLRALAVLLVVHVHAFPATSVKGFIGVDIFFVISGFLISSILLTQLRTGSFNLLDFYIRRVVRIFPALILVLAVSIGFGWLALYANEYKSLGSSIAAGVGFVANINFYLEAGYWDISSKLKPLLHLWSLGVEEQFYLLWPLGLWAAWNRHWNILTVCGVIVISSLSWNLISISQDQAATFYLPFSRFWELLSGAALACYCARAKTEKGVDTAKNTFFSRFFRQPGLLNNISAFLGITLIIAALLQRYPPLEFPGRHAILPVLGAALIILAGSQAWFNSRFLAHRWMVYIGLISYPLYLWHWPLLTFARLLEGGVISNQFRNAALFLAFVFAIVTYHFLEKPIRSHPGRRGVKAVILTVLLAVCGVFGYFIHAQDGLEIRYTHQKASAAPSIALSPASSSNTAKVVLLGDSNAMHFVHGLSRIYADTLVEIAIPGWPYLIGVSYKSGYIPPFKDHIGTPQATDQAIFRIISDPGIDVVIISNMFRFYFEGDLLRSYPNSPSGETTAMAYEAGLRRTVKTLMEAGKKVIVVKSIPVALVPVVAACAISSLPELPIRRGRPEACIRPREDVRKSREDYDLAVSRALAGYPEVAVFDTLDYLCDERYCYIEKDGVLMYNDFLHLSNAGSDVLGLELAKLIESKRMQ